MFLGIFVALLMLAAGVVCLLVSRHAGEPVGVGEGRVEQFATRVHDGLGRTANAVDVLVDRRPTDEVLRAPSAPEIHRTTYAIMGAGLIGLGAVALVGVALLLL